MSAPSTLTIKTFPITWPPNTIISIDNALYADSEGVLHPIPYRPHFEMRLSALTFKTRPKSPAASGKSAKTPGAVNTELHDKARALYAAFLEGMNEFEDLKIAYFNTKEEGRKEAKERLNPVVGRLAGIWVQVEELEKVVKEGQAASKGGKKR